MIDAEYKFYRDMACELHREHNEITNFMSGFGPKKKCQCIFCKTFREYNYIGDNSK